jgi:MSHA pilin protein MshD
MVIVVISIAVIGVVEVLNYTTRNSVDPQLRKQALSLAEGLLEEVELAQFTYCDLADPAAGTASSAADCSVAEGVGPEAGNSRPFDNVNDYVTAYGSAQSSFNNGGPTLLDANGTAFPVSGYSATLTISPDGGLGPAGSQLAGTEVLHISVTVSYSGGSVTLDGYRTRYNPQGPNAAPKS